MSENNGKPLPSNWAQAHLSAIAQINPRLDRKIESDDAVVDFVPMRAVEPEGGGLLRPVVTTYGKVKKGYTAFRSGDVIMAKITPCMENGKTCVVPELPGAACFGSTEFHVIRAEQGIDPRWIANYLLQHSTRHAAQRLMAGGVGQMRVPASFLDGLTLPVAPTSEQSRILDAIDELISDLDAGIVALERVRAKLGQYRSAVLRAAVEGELTADWRDKHPAKEPASELLERILAERRRRWQETQLQKFKDTGKNPPTGWKAKYPEPVAPDTTNLPPLPVGWCWASLDQIGALDRGRSRHRPRDANFLYGGPYPFVQTGDVRKASQYLRSHTQTYSEAGLKQSKLWPSETLCITIAANIAETAILSYPACFPDSIVGVLFNEGLVSVRYVEFFLRHARQRISAYAPATAQKNINNEILRAIAIPLPPHSEQLAVVDVVEDQLSVIEHLESDIESKLTGSSGLRQSLLHHAFTGRLVPHDAGDESASELLKRIAAEREQRDRQAQAAKQTAPKTNRPRKRTAKSRK